MSYGLALLAFNNRHRIATALSYAKEAYSYYALYNYYFRSAPSVPVAAAGITSIPIIPIIKTVTEKKPECIMLDDLRNPKKNVELQDLRQLPYLP
jgi:hypothetical protein